MKAELSVGYTVLSHYCQFIPLPWQYDVLYSLSVMYPEGKYCYRNNLSNQADANIYMQ
jgi:hypothetical protein